VARQWKWVLSAVTVAGLFALLAIDPAMLPSGPELRARIVGRYSPRMIRTWRPLWAISSQLQESVVIWEDPGFYFHAGLSFPDIFRALSADIRAGRFVRGGSTITQQIAKNLFLTRDKTLRRKYQDAIIARRLESVLSKDEILEVYLNIVEWGPDVYGAEAAARHYFHMSAQQLDWSQSALLAAILANPRTLNPCAASAAPNHRRETILARLRRDGRISAADHAAALARPAQPRCEPATTASGS